MSPPVGLAGVKKGDVVVVYEPMRGIVTRETVTAVARKYLTAGRYEYSIETGGYRHRDYSHRRTAYTVEQWEHRGASAAFRDAVDRLRGANASKASTADIRELTAQLNAVADRLAGGTS